MFGYWLMYLIPSFVALTNNVRGKIPRPHYAPWTLLGITFALFVGYRYQVGGDWLNYLHNYDLVRGETLFDVLRTADPGYAFINWLMYQWDWQIYGVNLICSSIFLVGLIVFAMQQPRPWLAFTVAVPYLVFVVAMGYTRQGVALGFFFLALASIENTGFKNTSGFVKFTLFIILATLFHKTALLLLALGIFLRGKQWKLRVLAIVLVGYGLWDLFLVDHQERLWRVYVDEQMISDGARIRVVMNLVPGLLLLYFRRQWKRLFPNYMFWVSIALFTIGCAILVEFASTAVDRVSLYFTPIQVAVFSRLPILAHREIDPKLTTVGIVLGYAAVLFVWFTYATHAEYWLPYQNWLLL